MELIVTRQDPLNVLVSTKRVVELAQSVSIDPHSINVFAQEIESKINTGLGSSSDHFGAKLSCEEMVQLVFIEDVLNFCTWAKKGRKRWRVSYPKGTEPSTGWYGKAKAFRRALDNNVPLLDATFLQEITEHTLREIFKGVDDEMLPLMAKRVQLLQEAGVFLENYGGEFMHVIEEARFDAINLSKILINQLVGFQDKTTYEGEEIFFYKRAQICASDVSVVIKEHTGKPLDSVCDLTAFADNALPHVMRRKGVLKYAKELSDKIDRYEKLESGSREEVEIRAATVWVAELVFQLHSKYSIQEIDYAMWQLSVAMPQDEHSTFHRTYSIYY